MIANRVDPASADDRENPKQWRVSTSRTSVSPIPCPSLLVVKKGVNT
ncbi:MAG: hypothetical protein GY716_23330 [bacterium]|nr:hypothetical protein [bacterium]